MLWLLLRINQLLKLNKETKYGNWEVLVWNWRVLQYIGRCPYICWKCQDTRRQNAQVFHLRTTIHWPDATGALQHKAQHQKPQSMCLSSTLHMSRGVPAAWTSGGPANEGHECLATLPWPRNDSVPHYLRWHPRNHLPPSLHHKPRTMLLPRCDIWNGTTEPLAPAIHLVPKSHSVTKWLFPLKVPWNLSPLFIRLWRPDHHLPLQFQVHLSLPCPSTQSGAWLGQSLLTDLHSIQSPCVVLSCFSPSTPSTEQRKSLLFSSDTFSDVPTDQIQL